VRLLVLALRLLLATLEDTLLLVLGRSERAAATSMKAARGDGPQQRRRAERERGAAGPAWA
jgi:hypothetical protein